MDNDQKKIIPGCEKLTKPEEISALSAYLKQGIRENEESLMVGDENPTMRAPVNPNLREFDLSKQTKVLINGTKEQVDLNSTTIKLNTTDNINSLNDSSVLLKTNEEKIILSDSLPQKNNLEITEVNFEKEKSR